MAGYKRKKMAPASLANLKLATRSSPKKRVDAQTRTRLSPTLASLQRTIFGQCGRKNRYTHRHELEIFARSLRMRERIVSTSQAINRRADETTKQLLKLMKVVQQRRRCNNEALGALLKAHDEDTNRMWSIRRRRDLKLCVDVATARKDRAEQRVLLKVDKAVMIYIFK